MFAVLQDDCNAAGKKSENIFPCLATVLLFFLLFFTAAAGGSWCIYGSCFISELTIK